MTASETWLAASECAAESRHGGRCDVAIPRCDGRFGGGLRPIDRRLRDDEEPPLGAHLVTPRLGFSHHGIYVGEGKVVHYGALAESLRRGPVEEVSVVRFAHGHAVWLRPCRCPRFGGQQVIRRARSRMGEDRYRLLSNNCEHFCEWCVHGEPRSYQVDKVLGPARRALRYQTAELQNCEGSRGHWWGSLQFAQSF